MRANRGVTAWEVEAEEWEKKTTRVRRQSKHIYAVHWTFFDRGRRKSFACLYNPHLRMFIHTVSHLSLFIQTRSYQVNHFINTSAVRHHESDLS